VTRNGSGGGKRRSLVQVHASPLGEDDVTSIGSIPLTSLARTVLDLCRTLPFEQAVAAGDHALRLGLLATALEEALALLAAWPGTRHQAGYRIPRRSNRKCWRVGEPRTHP
jgi:hypothetical protein